MNWLKNLQSRSTPQSRQSDHPVVVAVAPTGARRTKKEHPRLPLSADEIAAEAAQCADAGASLFHLHVRDRDGVHTLDADAYRAATTAIRRATGDRLIIQATTEAVGRYTRHEQIAMAREVKPQALSLAIRELIPDDAAESDAASFLAWLVRERIGRQYILFVPEDAGRLVALHRRGIIPDTQPNALFVLGRHTSGQQSHPLDLLPFLQAWPPTWPWSLCAFGATESRCVSAGIALGGHARVGFENNLLLPDGSVAPSNASLVALACRSAELQGRKIAAKSEVSLLFLT